MTLRPLLLAAVLASLSPTAPPSPDPTSPVDTPAAPEQASTLTLMENDFPLYRKEIGRLTLDPAPPPGSLERTEPRFLRLSLADIEKVPQLPPPLVVYQTVTTDTDLPVNLNLVVREPERTAACFNPEVPYCQGFDLLSTWMRQSGRPVHAKDEAAVVARFVVDLGTSTVHRPDNFLFFRLTGKFGVQFFQFLRSIDQIYDPHRGPHRTEAKAREVTEITERYRERVRPVTILPVEGGWQLHGFVFKTLRSQEGELREWIVTVHPDAGIDVDTKLLERGIGETSWSFAP